jgi:hypothetical protein
LRRPPEYARTDLPPGRTDTVTPDSQDPETPQEPKTKAADDEIWFYVASRGHHAEIGGVPIRCSYSAVAADNGQLAKPPRRSGEGNRLRLRPAHSSATRRAARSSRDLPGGEHPSGTRIGQALLQVTHQLGVRQYLDRLVQPVQLAHGSTVDGSSDLTGRSPRSTRAARPEIAGRIGIDPGS